MSAYPKTHNPFADDDEDVEDFGRGGGYDDSSDSGLSEPERRQRWLQQEVMRTAQSAADSSQRSLGLIYESEKMGTETAEELMRQGEALRRTEKMVDGMDQDLKTSQRHINSIRSVWGGFVNYFKAKPEATPPPETAPAYQPSSKLQNALTESKGQEHKYQESHPNLRKLPTSADSMPGSSSSHNGQPRNQVLKSAHQQLDDNLDEMCSGLSRLKNLGLGLQGEIESQDDSLDKLLGKVDNMDLKIRKTDQQIKDLK
ncbi:synaptosomal-associated protein 29 isoform X2 [Conger conger]|uniref:synaptosomal-associated protein 29 isoform X2 n=1 Tax=Conger conger TaxID=82655 RepID=UPI002A59D73E|nr:synaptosomal-associated protein 29 isoform X2 [Conger conger]